MKPDVSLLVAILGLTIPLAFLTIWLLVTSILGALSGWFRLQRAFPDYQEPAVERLRMQSGSVGPVRFNNCLRLDICPGGLRLSISRFLGPFLRPVFVPWSSIRAEPHRAFIGSFIRIGFGMPEEGSLVIARATAARLAKVAPLRLPQA
jgi:hypothetical protein